MSEDSGIGSTTVMTISFGFGVLVQRKLLSFSVLAVGTGGIGSTLLLFLATSGVRRSTVADHNAVEVSNLHWHVIHT